jgi:hypothetical protein
MSVLERKIKNFTESYQRLIVEQDYYSALAIGLTLPDICTKVENPEEKNTGKRYIAWFDKYMIQKYKCEIGPERKVYTFLSGKDFYALRCSFLHQGVTNIEKQRAREALKDFVFVKPQLMNHVHMNQVNDTLLLQVDVFCTDILLGVERWLDEYKDNHAMNQRAHGIMEIDNGITF